MRTAFIIAGIWLISLSLPQTGRAEPATAYYPLKPGMTWEYTVVSSKAGTHKITIKNLPARDLDGKKVTPREWNTGAGVTYYLVAADDAGVYRYGEQKSATAEPVVATPKVYYLREPVDRGTNWDIATRMGERQVKVNLTVDSIDDEIKVPAGTYKNCVKIKHEGEGKPEKDHPGLAITAFEWYAPGVGLVKSLVTITDKSKGAQAPETLTYQLDSFKP
jgi:hypothetical protein